SQCGHIDILVLNASMQFYDSVEAWNEEELRRELNVNLRASLQLIQAVVPGMRQQRWGRVLSIGSINQWKPSPRLLTYAASKAALSNLIQNCARQYAESGITFNTLAPGVITTDRNRVALSNQ